MARSKKTDGMALEEEQAVEEACFICGEDTSLVNCAVGCNKAYHASCVDLDGGVAPANWSCPRHFCAECKIGVDIYADAMQEDEDAEGEEGSENTGKSKKGNSGKETSAAFTCGTCPTSYCPTCIPKEVVDINKDRDGVLKRCVACHEKETHGEHKRGRAGAHQSGGDEEETAFRGYQPWTLPSHLQLQRDFIWNLTQVMRCQVAPEEMAAAAAEVERMGDCVRIFVGAAREEKEDSKSDMHDEAPATTSSSSSSSSGFPNGDASWGSGAYHAKLTQDKRRARSYSIPHVPSLAHLMYIVHKTVVEKGGLPALMRNHQWKPLARLIADNIALVPVYIPSANNEYI